MKKVVLSLVAVVMLCAAAQAAQPIKLSLWGPICIPNGDTTTGLEIAIGTQTQEVKGVQLALIYAQADKFTGAQLGFVNNTNDGLGIQYGCVNLAQEMKGAQLGFVNWTKGKMTGAQLGFVNYTESMKGLQIGLVNIIKNNTQFLPVFVFFNFCFA
ncbi:MAG: hypothetical protein II417_02705 [Elusimicrobia bacterium]|nr:hypothetical protein [Elusimicrobiota bacterium]